MNKKVLLMILDGWGITQNPKISAVEKANTPFIDTLQEKYPCAALRTDGEHVGLPKGQMGNSEVGHINLGAGRIVYQNLARINKAVEENTLEKEKVLIDGFSYAKKHHKNIHLLGLVSDGGIHSHIKHLEALLKSAKSKGIDNIYIHAFTDGRDCDPKSGKGFIKQLEDSCKKYTGKIATVIGRYYAMDRDNRWERIQLAYDAMINGVGNKTTDLVNSIQSNYDNGITDEFIKPIIITDKNKQAITKIAKDDVVIFFNFRTDRGRQLTSVLSQKDYPEYKMQKLDLHYITMTNYDDRFKDIHIIYNNDNIKNTLGEVLENSNKKQIRIAETEKYPHVTFFFSGGREQEFKGEKRILCPSPKVATYDLKPEMSAFEVTDSIIPELEKNETDFICLNFANGDMVGHTGDFDAAIKACETVDVCVERIITKALENNYSTIVIADHGNCETMLNPDGSPNTAHTTNPVPFIFVDNDIKAIKDGKLGDIAPTILDLMNIPKPEEMTGNSLL